MPGHRKTYSQEFKRRAVALHQTGGKPLRKLADELGVSESSLRRWVTNMQLHGGPDLSSRHADDCGCITCWRRKRA